MDLIFILKSSLQVDCCRIVTKRLCLIKLQCTAAVKIFPVIIVLVKHIKFNVAASLLYKRCGLEDINKLVSKKTSFMGIR